MLSCNLKGGLGNKMFQIAATCSLAANNNDESVFSATDVIKYHQPLNSYMGNIFRNITFDDSISEQIYFEPYFHYNSIPYIKNLKLDGYFQSEKYFNKKIIKKLFSIDDESFKYINEKYGDILKYETCSLHVRRGDYLKVFNFHPPCDIQYYNRAMKYFDDNIKYLIFSDDIEWCKENFIGDNFIFIEEEKDYIDMWIMSLCKHNIIANSSFSWWGAWLNNNQSKKVIAPQKWFGDSLKHNTKDLIPEEWTII